VKQLAAFYVAASVRRAPRKICDTTQEGKSVCYKNILIWITLSFIFVGNKMLFMRKYICLFLLIPFLSTAQDSLRVPVLFPGEACSVFPQNPGEAFFKASAGPGFSVDKPSVYINSDAEICFNPSKKSRFTYTADWNYTASYMYKTSNGGISVLYDFLKNPDYSLAAGMSFHVLARKLNWESLVFPDQLTIPDTIIESNQVKPIDQLSNAVATFHGHLVFTAPHMFATARFYDLTTPNISFVSYNEYTGGMRVTAGYRNDTHNGFRTIAAGWRMNQYQHHVFNIESTYQFHRVCLGIQLSTNKSGGVMLMYSGKKISVGVASFAFIRPVSDEFCLQQSRLVFSINL